MIDVLMIALQFAPVPTTGAYRVIEFAKRLPDLGIRPVILTIDPDQAEQILGAKRNPALLEGLPAAVRLEYIRSSVEPRPETDLQRLWRMISTFDDGFEGRFIGDLLQRAEVLAKEHNFAAVYATAPPFGAAGLGSQVANRLGVPYLLDMRDAWAAWSPAPQISRLHYWRKFVSERKAFSAADRIIAVTEELVDLFGRSHPEIPAHRFGVIPNGFPDAGMIPDCVEWEDQGPLMNVGYVGAFYYLPAKPASLRSPHRYLQYDPGTEDWSYRSPLYFFKAWEALAEVNPEAAARIRFHLVGGVPDWLPAMAEAHGVLDKCVFHGSMRKDEIPAFLAGMTCLLSTSMKRVGGDDYCLASKTFEYMASGRPILAFVCEGCQKRFFERSGGAFFFDPDDAQGSAEALAALSGARKTLRLDKSFLGAYALEVTAANMAEELTRLATRKSAGSAHAS